MADTKAHESDSMDRPVIDTPPAYSSRPQPTDPPVIHAPVGSMHAPVGTMHAPVGVMHAPYGVMHTPIGVVGTNVGNVGVVGMGVGHVGMGTTTVVPIMMAQQMSPRPVAMTCKSCHADITTRVDSKATWKTHFFAGALCLVGCWCCVWIPYFTKSCLDGEHYCPNCNAYIGSYSTYS